MQQTIALSVNGKQHEVKTDPERPLLDVLREDLHLMGAKFGCGERQCGACTVLINGTPTYACTTRVSTIHNRKIETIESLSDCEKLHPVQEAFLAEGALQCGYCTPGMIMTAIDMVRRKGNELDDHTIREELEGNICRCTGYHNIVKAIAAGARAMKGSDAGAKAAE
jgi:carbon-monoxide dehydrogenase small subunit